SLGGVPVERIRTGRSLRTGLPGASGKAPDLDRRRHVRAVEPGWAGVVLHGSRSHGDVCEPTDECGRAGPIAAAPLVRLASGRRPTTALRAGAGRQAVPGTRGGGRPAAAGGDRQLAGIVEARNVPRMKAARLDWSP